MLTPHVTSQAAGAQFSVSMMVITHAPLLPSKMNIVRIMGRAFVAAHYFSSPYFALSTI